MALALTQDQKDAIWFVLRRNFGPDVKVWVFGSRALGEDTGDIDLYAEVSDETDAIIVPRGRARRQLEALLDNKVDLIVRRSSGQKSVFDEVARKRGVALQP
ncbi:nucleotidyltransferase domain-containing protein [Azospirillum sp. sgz301742]